MLTINKRIMEALPSLTHKQVIIGEYICNHIYEVALMNASKIAKEVGVSEATITRFVYALGYNTFSDFQMDIRKQAQEGTRHSFLRQIVPGDEKSDTFHDVFSLEKALLDETLANVTHEEFLQFVNTLVKAKNIILVGGPTQHYIVEYFADYLSIIKENVHVVNQKNMRLYGELGFQKDHTVAVIFSYPRYPQETLEIAKILCEQNITILAITDSYVAPIVHYANQALITPLQYILFIEPASPVFALLHSILVEMYRRDEKNIKQQLKTYESLILMSDMFAIKDYDFTMKLG